jgi:hypothetical protein
MLFIESVLAQFPSFATSGVFKVLKVTVPSGKTHCSPYKFKIAGLVKKWTIWGTFGPKFPFFIVYGHLRAAGVPIGPL